MGNCQAIDSATLVIQYPKGRVGKLYWPVPAAEIMKMNPGHRVALLLTTTICPSTSSPAAAATTNKINKKNVSSNNPVRITRIKILRPTDTLALGHVYRLITTQEVMRGLWVKKYAKLKKAEQQDKAGRLEFDVTKRSSEKEKFHQHERHGQRTATAVTGTAPPPAKPATARSRAWQPALHSISEAGS